MLKIRLRRMGAKKSAFYRIVVSDSRSTPGSRFLDVLGTYDPGTDPATVKLEAKIGIGQHVGHYSSPSMNRIARKMRPNPVREHTAGDGLAHRSNSSP